jgi:hypothetical protein
MVFLVFPCTKMLFIMSLLVMVSGCASVPEPNSSLSQQAAADYVLNFQSWKAISFIKPDIASTATGLAVRPKMFTGEALIKLLNNMKRPRRFIVVVLDRRHSPDPAEADGGMDHIQTFFEHLGFQRVVIQDGSAWDDTTGYPILRDTEKADVLKLKT